MAAVAIALVIAASAAARWEVIAAVSEAAPEASVVAAPERAAAEAPQAWVASVVEAEAAVAADSVVVEAVVAAAGVAVVAVAVVDGKKKGGTGTMNSAKSNYRTAGNFFLLTALAVSCLAIFVKPLETKAQAGKVAAQAGKATTAAAGKATVARGKAFATPEEAASALVGAAENYDPLTLEAILGPGSHQIVSTGETARDKENAGKFAALAKAKQRIEKDPKNARHATLIVGDEDWPFPVPIVEQGAHWYFDSKAGLHEILLRRVGQNELDAIQICRGYVEAQNDYALAKHGDSAVNQYAQKIISTAGKQDGLAWKNEDGTWGGPVGENIAKAIERGYTSKREPYHGYFFKILKGQGPDAPLGQLDYVVKGVMIGGFALIAAPAEYRVTGVKTFMVSQDGVVYQKDLGPDTLELAKKMELFNPDKSWTPVLDEQ